MSGVNLKDWGWSSRLAREFARLEPDLLPARVTCDSDGVLQVLSPLGELEVRLPGKFRLLEPQQRPVVGDWLAIRATGAERDFVAEVVLERQTQILRQAAGRRTEAQVLAANVDLIFVVSSLDREFNPRRLERYLVTAWESGARPIILLSKLDRCDKPADFIDAAREIASGVTVIAYSVVSGIGLATIRREIKADTTVVLLGSSGVGKSTLVNTLLDHSRFRTQAVRSTDQRGRHTTTHRELVRIPSGGLLIDTPGLRELHLWDAEEGLSQVFADFEEFAAKCRFNDCTHDHEPECAVIQAVASGALSQERHQSYLNLRREAAHQRRRRDLAESLVEKRRMRSQQKHLRRRIEEKDRT